MKFSFLDNLLLEVKLGTGEKSQVSVFRVS